MHRPSLAYSIRLSLIGLLLCTVLLTQPLYAALPTPASLTQQLDKLKPEDTSPATQALREVYQQTQSALENLSKLREHTQQLNDQIEQQPERLADLRQALDSPLPEEPNPVASTDSNEQLEQQLTQARSELVELEQRRDQLSEAIGRNDAQMIDLRTQLTRLKQNPVEQVALPEVEGTEELLSARQDLNEVLAEEQTARIKALELELLALPGELELNLLRLSQTRRKIDRLSTNIDEVQRTLLDRRRLELEQSLAELEPDSEALPTPLAQLRQLNRDSNEQLSRLLRHIDSSHLRLKNLNGQLEKINQQSQLIQQQLELDIPQLSAELRHLSRQLTRPLDTTTSLTEINQLRLANLSGDRELFELQQRKNSLPDQVLALDAIDQQRYRDLIDSRQRLLEQLRQSRQQLINVRSQILSTQQQINDQTEQARTLIEQHLLWLPTVEPLDSDWFNDLQSGFTHLQQRWQQLNAAQPLLVPSHSRLPLIGLPLLLAAAALSLSRYLRKHRQRWHQQIGKVSQDRFSRTFRLLVAAPLIATPLPTFALLLQYSLNTAHPLYDTITSLLYALAAIAFVDLCALGWLRTPHGLLCAHLEIPERLCRVLRREISLLGWVTLPLLAGLFISDGVEQADLLASGGRLLFLLLTLILLRFWWVMWKINNEFNRLTEHPSWWTDSRLWIGGMLAFNLVMFGLGIYGYLLGALFLMLILTLLVIQVALVFMLYRLGRRWLLIEERRIAFKQAQERRAEQIAARSNPEEEDLPQPKEDYIDLKTISDQARTLNKLTAIALLALLIWLTLGDFLPTLQILERIPLWSTYQTTAAGEVLRAITLSDLITGLIILAVSLLAAYNLPGLLELLVLRHLKLSPGTGFAVTTLLKYILILVGVMAGISQFGLEWNKLQWLVAALGVGLGFGLQEIVANFVSGLILLFEKPIRIGDTVTIGDVTGRVSQIQIRATTLIDWDRKEVVIPNKTFITERLINWSLTDATTRIVLQVGVAYGSDTEQVKQLLVEIAKEHPLVLKDPEPDAYFRTFGASTLDFDLRVFVAHMEDRIPVTDALNHSIDRHFRDAGIEIAFPQLDVHLHRSPPKT
ncbi:miniconductance mechanosensitive channel MscM [Marinobacterium zhoushanense]|uniref:Miniconductance mechanosensitive channel MscM n=1 Tax=Marinobacterium zhoushanense TaxID=1679163 RepID=A0ABQ1KJW9_9GAMM|nr:mechanosensitive ion channel domain-containing protein [Marinobacterium zhoushanense]GGB98204.1 miniconductance mechanosensitive channel MscM [Marinobacterium zhoushanense]